MAKLTGEYVAKTYTKLLQIDPDGSTSSTYIDIDLDTPITNGLGEKHQGIVFERKGSSTSYTRSGIYISNGLDANVSNRKEMFFSMSGGNYSNHYGEIVFSATGSSPTLYIISERDDNSNVPGNIKIQTKGLGFSDLPQLGNGDIIIQTGENSIDTEGSSIILYSEKSRYFIGLNNKQPISEPLGPTQPLLSIDSVSGQLYTSGKSFVINNPLDYDKYLVHACIEGPELAVFYRGESKLINGEVEIKLPEYFESLTHETNRTVQLTPISNENGKTDLLSSSKVIDGKFKVKSILEVNLEQEFYWEVKAERKDVDIFEVEPKKSDYYLNGDGPYTYLTRK